MKMSHVSKRLSACLLPACLLTLALATPSPLMAADKPAPATTSASDRAPTPPAGAVVLDAKELGAVGDGQADDTDALQRGLDRLAETGGTLYLPPGQYRVTRTLRVTGLRPSSREPMHWIEIRGEGESSRLVGDGTDYILAAKEMFDDKGKRRYINGLVVRSVAFTSFDMARDKRTGGIDASYILRWFCQDSRFIGCKTGIYSVGRDVVDPTKSTSTWIIRINDNLFTACTDYAIKLGRVFDLVIDNNVIEHGSGGIAIGEPGDKFDAAANTVRITNNVIEGLTTSGKPAILGSCWIGATISGNYFEANPSGDIVLTPDSGTDGVLRGVTITGNTFQPTAKQRATDDYGPIHLNKARDILITGNFTTGGRLLHGKSRFVGNVNLTANVLNNPEAVGTMEGAKPDQTPADFWGAHAIDRERWTVAGRQGTAGLDSARGLTIKPRGEKSRSLTYAAAPPSGGEIAYEAGDLILNITPTVEGNRMLFGWSCVTSGKPGTWRPLYVLVD